MYFLLLLFQVHDRTPEYYDIEFRCLQYALFGCCFFQAAGSFAFLVMSWYVFKSLTYNVKNPLNCSEKTLGLGK